MNITLNLNLDAVNVILNALVKLPYEQVYNLVESIQEQAAPQIQAMEFAPTAKMADDNPPVGNYRTDVIEDETPCCEEACDEVAG